LQLCGARLQLTCRAIGFVFMNEVPGSRPSQRQLRVDFALSTIARKLTFDPAATISLAPCHRSRAAGRQFLGLIEQLGALLLQFLINSQRELEATKLAGSGLVVFAA